MKLSAATIIKTEVAEEAVRAAAGHQTQTIEVEVEVTGHPNPATTPAVATNLAVEEEKPLFL